MKIFIDRTVDATALGRNYQTRWLDADNELPLQLELSFSSQHNCFEVDDAHALDFAKFLAGENVNPLAYAEFQELRFEFLYVQLAVVVDAFYDLLDQFASKTGQLSLVRLYVEVQPGSAVVTVKDMESALMYQAYLYEAQLITT